MSPRLRGISLATIILCAFAGSGVGCGDTEQAEAARIQFGKLMVLDAMAAIEDSYGQHPNPDPDTTCMLLVYHAAEVMESEFRDHGSFDAAAMTPDALAEVDPSISFLPVSDAGAATDPTAQAPEGEVDYWGSGRGYVVGSRSSTGRTFSLASTDFFSRDVTMYIDGCPASWFDDSRAQYDRESFMGRAVQFPCNAESLALNANKRVQSDLPALATAWSTMANGRG